MSQCSQTHQQPSDAILATCSAHQAALLTVIGLRADYLAYLSTRNRLRGPRERMQLCGWLIASPSGRLFCRVRSECFSLGRSEEPSAASPGPDEIRQMNKTPREAQTRPPHTETQQWPGGPSLGPQPVSRGVLAAPPPALPLCLARPSAAQPPHCPHQPMGPSDRSPGPLGTVRPASAQAGLEQPPQRRDSWPGTHSLPGKQKAGPGTPRWPRPFVEGLPLAKLSPAALATLTSHYIQRTPRSL